MWLRVESKADIGDVRPLLFLGTLRAVIIDAELVRIRKHDVRSEIASRLWLIILAG